MQHVAKTLIQNSKDHTMGDALFRYLAIKIHPLIPLWQGKIIVVRGRYNREQSIISAQEKTDKLFNWKRPTAEISKDNKILYINCFPGIDYVHHYATLIKTYFHINQLKNTYVFFEHPTQQQITSQLYKTNLIAMPPHDIVVIGKVENLQTLTNNHPWEGDGDFYWSSCCLGGKKVALLGCAFSIWGDIAGKIISILGHNNSKSIIYTGKLGGLSEDMRTNQMLATGNQSMLSGKIISWNNIIKIPPAMDNVLYGNHITLFSTLAETKKWFNKVGQQHSFVDPEIGHMAHAAIKNKINFGYIHLVSDNVARSGKENLSNEREQEIVEKRTAITANILSVIHETIDTQCKSKS